MNYLDSFILKDARLLTEVIQEPVVDVVITSPPYWNLKDYSTPAQIGFGQTREEYLNDVEKVLANCFKVTKDTGSLWLVVDTYRLDGELHMLPWEIAEKAKNVGWQLRELIIWDKQHNVPWQKKGQMRHVTEFILFFSKGSKFRFYIDRIKTLDELSKWWADFPERFNPKGKTPSNIWSIPVRRRGAWPEPSTINHHCPFPTALVSRIIELTTNPGDLVMDPFGGSGVVLGQACAMDRHFVGFEVNSDYIDLYKKVVKQEVVKEWAEIQDWRSNQVDAIKDFEQTILKLRSLKYSWQVLKTSIDSLPIEEYKQIQAILSIASIPTEFQRGKPFKVDIYVITAKRSDVIENSVDEARIRSKKSPLTHFGIVSEIHLITNIEVEMLSINKLQLMYLYVVSKFRKPSMEISLQNWLHIYQNERYKNERNKMYLLSNVYIDLSFIQT